MLFRIALIYVVFSSAAYAYGQIGPVSQGGRINPNQTLLSSKNGKEAAAIINQHAGNPGCYILCLGPQDAGLYSIGSTYNLHGLIRIQGQYPTQSPTNKRSKRYCYPSGSQEHYFAQFKNLCDATFSSCNGKCTGNGDTGGFYTNPPVR